MSQFGQSKKPCSLHTSDHPKKIIFLHIPKTAGRTLEWNVLKREYRGFKTFNVNAHQLSFSLETLSALTVDEQSTIAVVTGHIPFGVHDLLHNSFTYVTLLRHPVSRVISLYYHIRNDDDHYFHEDARGLCLREFLSDSRLFDQTSNGQTRLLAGRGYVEPGRWSDGGPEPCTAADLAIAKERLRTDVEFGLTERFNESLVLLAHVLNWKHLPIYKSKNKGKYSHSISKEVQQVISEQNLYDLELYRFASTLFSERVSRYRGFQSRLRALRIANFLYNLAPSI